MENIKTHKFVPEALAPKRYTQVPTFLIAILGLILSAFIFDFTHDEERDHLRDNFINKSRERVSVIREVIDDNFEQLYSMAALFNSIESVNKEQFRLFALELLSHHDALSLDYLSYVKADERVDFEIKAQKKDPDFQIRELDIENRWVSAKKRGAYFPIYYSESLRERPHLRGFDLGPNEIVKETMARVIETHAVVASPPFFFYGKMNTKSKNIVGFEAIYKKNTETLTESQRQKNLKGFVVLTLDGMQMIEQGLSFQKTGGIHVQVLDVTDPENRIEVYTHRSRHKGSTNRKLDHDFENEKATLFYSETISVAGRLYRITCIPISQYRSLFGRNYSVILFGASLLIAALLTFYMAVSIKKQQMIRTLLDHLSISEAETVSILENATDAIVRIDRQGHIEKLNKAAKKMLGYRDEELEGQNITRLLPGNQKNNHGRHLEEYQKTGRANILGMSGREFVALRKNGERFPFEISVIETKRSGEVFFTAFLKDITERKQVEARLEQLVAQKTADLAEALGIAEHSQIEAEKANQLKTEFLANMSHELRTPMHSIITFSRQGMEYIENWTKEAQTENLLLINESGKRLLVLLNNLLDIAKLEAGVVEYTMSRANMRTTVEQVTRHLKSLLEDSELSLKIEQRVVLSDLEYDQEKITRVILNLMANAIKFSPEGAEIGVSFKEDQVGAGALTVSISDEGMGIPDDELRSVFDKFIQSSKTKSNAGGTGLGLAICKEIIDGHGGRIWAENNIKRGATFAFRLPIKQSSSG